MTDRRHAIDLATGEHVTVIVATVGDRDEHARWVSRCDSRYRLHACAGDNLVDFGTCGESHRFEAWRRMPTRSTPHGVLGIHHIERRVEAALAELFDGDRLTPRVVCVFGPRGCGKTRVLTRLARSARLSGFVPFAVDLLDSPLSAAIDGRSVCLIDDDRRSRPGVLVELALRSPRPHVILSASIDDVRDVPSVGLTKLTAGALVSSVVPRDGMSEAVLRRAAERADGNPGRFIGLINPSGEPRVRFDPRRSTRGRHFTSSRAGARLRRSRRRRPRGRFPARWRRSAVRFRRASVIFTTVATRRASATCGRQPEGWRDAASGPRPPKDRWRSRRRF